VSLGLLCVLCLVVLVPFVEETDFSIALLLFLFVPLSKSTWLCLFLGCLFVISIYFSPLLQSHCLTYNGFLIHHEVRECQSSDFVFLQCVHGLGLLLIHVNFRMSLPISAKKLLEFWFSKCINFNCELFKYLLRVSLSLSLSLGSGIWTQGFMLAR
jgi:hypothetical protein